MQRRNEKESKGEHPSMSFFDLGCLFRAGMDSTATKAACKPSGSEYCSPLSSPPCTDSTLG